MYLVVATIFTYISEYRYLPWLNNILQSIFNLIEISFFAFIFLSFSDINKKAFWLNFIIIGFGLISMVEYSVQGLNTYRQSFTEIIFGVVVIILGIFCINKILESDVNRRYKWIKLLIVIPTVLFSCFYTYFNILLLILYTPKNRSFFILLLRYVNIFDLFAYISYTISFICLPKKKIFL